MNNRIDFYLIFYNKVPFLDFLFFHPSKKITTSKWYTQFYFRRNIEWNIYKINNFILSSKILSIDLCTDSINVRHYYHLFNETNDYKIVSRCKYNECAISFASFWNFSLENQFNVNLAIALFFRCKYSLVHIFCIC